MTCLKGIVPFTACRGQRSDMRLVYNPKIPGRDSPESVVQSPSVVHLPTWCPSEWTFCAVVGTRKWLVVAISTGHTDTVGIQSTYSSQVYTRPSCTKTG